MNRVCRWPLLKKMEILEGPTRPGIFLPPFNQAGISGLPARLGLQNFSRVSYLVLSTIPDSMRTPVLFLSAFGMITGCAAQTLPLGQTRITTWQSGKTGAVSLTYDDGIRTQFSDALPVMDHFNLPATFFVITGPITGSRYPSRFIGRPIADIVRETGESPTGKNNFFERASAARYLGFKGTLAYYDRASELYESGRIDSAYHLMDELYRKVRSGGLPPGKDTSMEIANEIGLSWDYLRQLAARGYEIASHTVTHEHLAIMDTSNMMYELRKSKQDILEHLGSKYTFSAEVPFGIDDPRVMKAALPVYPALRNLMPEPYMTEINRGERQQPGLSGKPYVQWQRGPGTRTTLSRLESWVDTTIAHNNIWLVLVIHGVDGVGYEPMTRQTLYTYFQYIHDHEKELWVATFMDVTKYMRERMDNKPEVRLSGKTIRVKLHPSLNPSLYNIPLTLKTYVPHSWNGVEVLQGKTRKSCSTARDGGGTYVLYQVAPDDRPVRLSMKD